jgi:4-hydroxy-3-polyprenylbenzoate decarboxylase
MQRLIVGISGASGTIYGVRLLEALRQTEVETHLILTAAGRKVAELETGYTGAEIEALADKVYSNDDLAAAISSGSFLNMGMIVAPCSIKSLSAIAHSYNDTLLARAADVALKERRKLILVVRETPLSLIHLENLLTVARAGAIVLPAAPSYYTRPATVDAVVDTVVGRVLDQLGISASLAPRWGKTP